MEAWDPANAMQKSKEDQAAEEAMASEVERQFESRTQELNAEMAALAAELKALQVKNETEASELEKMGREEFCVDVDQKDLLVAEADKTCAKIKKDTAKANLARELIKNRLVHEFWKPMKG